MDALTQAHRPIAVSTPLGDDVLLFQSMMASEHLGRLFEFNLELLSEDENIKLPDILGQNVTVRLELPEDQTRYFNGFVSRFSQVGRSGRLAVYQATLRPWLWFLTRTSDCRIFQEKTVPDIIKEIFREHGFTDIDDKLSGSYRTWVYCVQYRETDFNFVSRLMEQEGIYYYFKHEDGKHSLVLSDSYSAHERISGYEEISYYPPSEAAAREDEHIYDWHISQEVQPGTYALDDFDFERPKVDLTVKSSIAREHAKADYEIYDYPGEYLETGDGQGYVRARIEELQAQYEQLHGEGNARGLTVGGLFELSNYPREDQNREYLITSANHYLQLGGYESHAPQDGPLYSCNFTAIDAKQGYRASRITPKPVVQGPQTAVVVGPSGEEIWTDKYGRVKVQFHWDRKGRQDENSSCWVRVSQPWAGKNWGAVAIPRMGQEVIVSFLEGDPDQPIITGRVYNADNMPPYDLPANATQTGIKSRSSKGGSADNFNEIRFEDKKGEEQLSIHAEKNQDIAVENDESHSIGNNRTKDVGNDEKISVGNDQTYSIGNNQSGTVGVNLSLSVGSNKTETVGINTAETIGAAKELTIGGAYQVTVGGAMNETVGAVKAEEIGGAKTVAVGINSSEKVGKDKSVQAGGNISECADKDVSIAAGKQMTLTAGDDFTIQGKKKGVIDIADQLTIQCGKAVIQMKKNGDILINGKKITVKGSGNIVMKAQKILEN